MRTSLFTAISALFCFSAFASTITATTSTSAPGDWNVGSTWSSGTVPQSGDLVIIPLGTGVQVSSHIYPSSVPNLSIEVFGTLNFRPSGKLDLGPASYLQIFLLGKIVPQNTSSSQLVTIGGVTKYNAANNGIVLGPAYANALSGTSTAGAPLSGFDVGVLPIKLAFFSAKESNGVIELQWQTLDEVNADYFEIERSTDGGRTWKVSNITPAKGTAHSYSASDRTFSHGSALYRLRSVDKDGRTSYSSIVRIEKPASSSVIVSPNPAKDVLNINLREQIESGYTIQLMNSLGQPVNTIPCARGRNNYQIDLHSSPKGIYVLAVFNGSRQISKETVVVQ